MTKEALREIVIAESKRGITKFSPHRIFDMCKKYFNFDQPKDGNSPEEKACRYFGLKEEELKTTEKTIKKVLIAKCLCYRELIELGFSKGYIGERFNRDRTSVLYGLNVLKKELKQKFPLTVEMERIYVNELPDKAMAEIRFRVDTLADKLKKPKSNWLIIARRKEFIKDASIKFGVDEKILINNLKTRNIGSS